MQTGFALNDLRKRSDELNKKGLVIISIGLIVIVSIIMYILLYEKESDFEINIHNSKTEVITSTIINTSNEKAKEITAYKKEIVTTEKPTKPTDAVIEFPININMANKAELMMLDGIGEALSERIIQYREMNGEFKNIEEIMLVNGIGQSKFEVISKNIYVDNPVYSNSDESEEDTDDADAEELTDIDLTEESEVYETEEAEETTAYIFTKYDLNKVTKDELLTIPEMTEENAEKILSLRESIGEFSHVYEIYLTDGISRTLAAKYVEYLEIVE